MSVVRDNDPVVLDIDPTGVRVSVVGVLDEFCQRNVRLTDEAFAQFPQQGCVDGELCGCKLLLLLLVRHRWAISVAARERTALGQCALARWGSALPSVHDPVFTTFRRTVNWWHAGLKTAYQTPHSGCFCRTNALPGVALPRGGEHEACGRAPCALHRSRIPHDQKPLRAGRLARLSTHPGCLSRRGRTGFPSTYECRVFPPHARTPTRGTGSPSSPSRVGPRGTRACGSLGTGLAPSARPSAFQDTGPGARRRLPSADGPWNRKGPRDSDVSSGTAQEPAAPPRHAGVRRSPARGSTPNGRNSWRQRTRYVPHVGG